MAMSRANKQKNVRERACSHPDIFLFIHRAKARERENAEHFGVTLGESEKF